MADALAGRSRPRVRYRYRIRLAGLLFLAVTLLLGVAAATRPNNLLVWIFGLMLGSILVSGVVSGFMLMKLSVRRLGPRRAVAGEPANLRYEIANESRVWSAFGLPIRERPMGETDGWERFADPVAAGVVREAGVGAPRPPAGAAGARRATVRAGKRADSYEDSDFD